MDITAQAEQALIGSILNAPDKLVDIVGVVNADDFTDPIARHSYLTALRMWRSGETVDLTTVAISAPESAPYLAESTSKGLGIGALDYARQVANTAKNRRVSESLAEIQKSKLPVGEKLDDILRLYQREVSVSSKSAKVADVMKRFNAQQRENRKLKRLGWPTGFNFLEENYIQYVPGHIWLMGAYTSVGKTAMMVQKVCNLLSLDREPSIIIISTEMTEEQVVARILSNFTGVHSVRILSGNYRQGEEELVEEYKKLITTRPLMIFDSVYEVGAIETIFKKAHLQGGVNIGFVDYVQNCRVRGAQSAYQESSEMAKRLQAMAKDVRCTLVCLSQVSNDIGRGNTDQLEFKGAGEWAAVADVGIYLQRNKNNKYAMKYSVKKNRHGKLLEQEFEYKHDFTRLEVVEG